MSAQVVLITGCSRGIGHGIALYLAKDLQRRFKVYATMRNPFARQDDLITKAGSNFEDTLFIKELDVTKQETIDKTVKEIVDKEGRIDVLVNNAGAYDHTWWQIAPMETFYDVMEVNYFGCVRTTKAVVPFMKAKRSGRILQISSAHGFKAEPIITQFVASKFALEGFSEAIAPPLRKFNVWVSVIQPGYVATDMTDEAGDPGVDPGWDEEVKQIPGEDGQILLQMLSSNPESEPGTKSQTPTDIATVVEEALLSPKPDFRYQTSQTVKDMARLRFIDPTGNDTIGIWLK